MKIKKIIVGKNLSGMQMNVYLIIQNNVCAIVDPGDEANKITQMIKEEHCKPQFIVLTHGHIDHIKDAGLLSLQYNIPIYIHEKDKNFITDKTLNLSSFANIEFNAFTISHFLQDREIVKLEKLKIVVIHTPGHTPGSICLQCEDVLLTGDTLFEHGIGRTDLPGSDEKALQNSINKKLFVLEKNYKIFPGHGAMTTLTEERGYFYF